MWVEKIDRRPLTENDGPELSDRLQRRVGTRHIIPRSGNYLFVDEGVYEDAHAVEACVAEAGYRVCDGPGRKKDERLVGWKL